ncbi:MAG: hypothetical protein EP330_09250 [Deltaproteobacteria bacterium]|nr:MAG: hypothetical protein EP330_09250 [Deltaproteobacteria bacterium]
MSTWSELYERARTEPGFIADSDEEFSLVYEWRDARGEVRAQRVWARYFEAWTTPMLEVRSAFAPADAMPAVDALVHNLDLPLGAIARHGDILVVVHKQPLEPITVEGVLFALRRVSMVADMLEAKRGVDRF